jgi:hypothetical protein
VEETRVAEKTTFRRSLTNVTTGHLEMQFVQINMQYYILCSIRNFSFRQFFVFSLFYFISYSLTICCYIFEHSEGRTACRSGTPEFIPCFSGGSYQSFCHIPNVVCKCAANKPEHLDASAMFLQIFYIPANLLQYLQEDYR